MPMKTKLITFVLLLVLMCLYFFYSGTNEVGGNVNAELPVVDSQAVKKSPQSQFKPTINGNPVPSGVFDIPREQIVDVYREYDVYSVAELEQMIQNGDNVAAYFLGRHLRRCASLKESLESIDKLVAENQLVIAEQRMESYDHLKNLCDQASPQLKDEWYKLLWLAADRGDVWAQLNVSASFPKEMIEKSFKSPEVLQEIIDRTWRYRNEAANSGFAPAISELGYEYQMGYFSEFEDSQLMAATYFKITIDAGALPPNSLENVEREYNAIINGLSDEDLLRLDAIYRRIYATCCQ